MRRHVAFIGLGRMGSAIAANILKSGAQMTVWNRTRSKCEGLEAAGATVAETPRAAAAAADLVVTALMDDKAILSAVDGEQGILAGLQPGKTHLCVATISPALAGELGKRHAAAGSFYVSGPVVGRPDAAAAGKLISYLAGSAEAIDLAREVAATYSRSVRIVAGPAGAANTVKLCINYSIVALIETIGEVYAFAEKSGVDPAVLNAYYQEAFALPGLQLYASKILSRDFRSGDGFALSGGFKDVNLMLDAARAVGTDLDIAAIVQEKMRAAMENDMTDADWSGVTEITRMRAGLT